MPPWKQSNNIKQVILSILKRKTQIDQSNYTPRVIFATKLRRNHDGYVPPLAIFSCHTQVRVRVTLATMTCRTHTRTRARFWARGESSVNWGQQGCWYCFVHCINKLFGIYFLSHHWIDKQLIFNPYYIEKQILKRLYKNIKRGDLLQNVSVNHIVQLALLTYELGSSPTNSNESMSKLWTISTRLQI